MKIRTLVTSTLLAAGLGIGLSAPAQAHDSFYSLWWLDHDHHPRQHHDRHYDDYRHHGTFRKHVRKHHRRDHDRYAWHHDDDRRHDRRHRDRDHDRYDDHGRRHRR